MTGAGAFLFVEDNADVAAFAHTLLEELGHQVLYAQSAEAALELVCATRRSTWCSAMW